MPTLPPARSLRRTLDYLKGGRVKQAIEFWPLAVIPTTWSSFAPARWRCWPEGLRNSHRRHGRRRCWVADAAAGGDPRLRLKEAQAAADVIGARFHFAGGEDLEVDYNDEYRRRAVRVMRAANPTIVFTHPPMDYLVDHEETSRLVRNAAYIGPVPNYDCGAPTTPTSRIPYLYYANASAGGTSLAGHCR